jgi:hypothetical protein
MAVAPAAEVEGGAALVLKAKASCLSGCDLWGKLVRIVAHDAAVVKEAVLVSSAGGETETSEFAVTTPFEPGEYTWTVLFPAQDKGGVRHEEASAPFSFTVKPHAIRISVLEAPSPVGYGAAFEIKVGVRCSGACDLTGMQVEVFDDSGEPAASGALGPVPWATADGLYGAVIALIAPDAESRFVWRVSLPGQQLAHDHAETGCSFAFSVAGQPEHLVTVKVVDRETGTPVSGARVILRPSTYRGCEYEDQTGDDGMARIRVPSGEYRIGAASAGRKSFQVVREIAGDTAVEAALATGYDLDDIYG